KTEWVYWDRDLHSLASGLGELLCPWRVSSSGPVEPVAREVLRVFGGYGWPAIQAALDNPGYPEDPTVRWPRAFPKIPRGPLFDGEVAATERSRAELEELMTRADSDPRAFQALLARLETEPHPGIRQGAAWWLLRRASEERSRQALRAAAAEDEDVAVRWIARYALRLADRGTAPGRPGSQGPPCPRACPRRRSCSVSTSACGRGGLWAGRAEAAELAQEVEPEPRARRERDDRQQEADKYEHDLPAGAAMTAEDAPLVQPVTRRLRCGAVTHRAPPDRQSCLRGPRQLRLQARQAVLLGRALTEGAFRCHIAHGRADDAVAVQRAPDRERVDVEQQNENGADHDRDLGDVPL